MSEPYYSDELVTLYLADAREEKVWLDADVLITDPPYGLGGNLSMPGFGGQDEFGVQAWDSDLEARDAVLAMWGTEKPYAVFGSPRLLHLAPPHREIPLVWSKGELVGMGDGTFPWKPSYELIYVGGRPWTGRRRPAVIEYRHSNRAATNIGHPTPKPVGLMAELIDKSQGVVADPFAGSGATLIAAAMAGRRAIGVEIEETYAEVAARRLSQQILTPPAEPVSHEQGALEGG